MRQMLMYHVYCLYFVCGDNFFLLGVECLKIGEYRMEEVNVCNISKQRKYFLFLNDELSWYQNIAKFRKVCHWKSYGMKPSWFPTCRGEEGWVGLIAPHNWFQKKIWDSFARQEQFCAHSKHLCIIRRQNARKSLKDILGRIICLELDCKSSVVYKFELQGQFCLR